MNSERKYCILLREDFCCSEQHVYIKIAREFVFGGPFVAYISSQDNNCLFEGFSLSLKRKLNENTSTSRPIVVLESYLLMTSIKR
jgi:hypothetical protein